MRIDPSIVADEVVLNVREAAGGSAAAPPAARGTSDIRAAFGE
jgi:hypothetical protein